VEQRAVLRALLVARPMRVTSERVVVAGGAVQQATAELAVREPNLAAVVVVVELRSMRLATRALAVLAALATYW
jgi:hypothetical protein